MKRTTLWALGLIAPAAVATALALRPAATEARPGTAPAPDSPRIPVRQVTLFSSGVGYFQREGEVDGDARVDLTFPVGDINDLIKSLTLQDLNGGLVSAVSYDSHDPVERTLKSFAVDLTGQPGQAQLLEQARGEKIEVVLNQTSNQPAGTLIGTIVGVEFHRQIVGDKAVSDVAFLNLWCADGLRSIKLADAQRIRFLNSVLENEYRRALDTLALSHDAQKKAVSLQFSGQGKRKVRVGYVTESPIWKTSYRLSLPPAGEGKPQLQGWAVVENPTDEDWNGVRMALVSGRPISFKMDLYQPLYAPRPTIEPELFASLRPQTYEADMERRARPAGDYVIPDALNMNKAMTAMDAKGKKSGNGLARPLMTVAEPAPQARERKESMFVTNGGTLNLGQGVASAASAEKLGESFQYRIEQPVHLPRQKSALLPIVQHDIEAGRVSVYNPSVHAKYPLLGLKLKNTTGLNLMQGPITVFDSGVYAGDARILDLQPNDERILTFAVDLGMEVEAKSLDAPTNLTAVRIKKGVVYSTTRLRESKTYRAVNRSQDDRMLLVEHPYRAEFKLASDVKPAERTRDMYRFELKVPKGKSAEVPVVEERDLTESVTLTNAHDHQIRFFLQQQVLSKAVREAFEKSVELRGKLADVQRELEQVNRQLAQIEKDQNRLRENLKATPPTAAAYKRYLEKLDAQEVEIEKLQANREKLQMQEHQSRTTYEGFLMALNVE